MSFSKEPYFFSRVIAVFSPIPGTPGMLSDLSPVRALISESLKGSIPYFFIKSSLVTFSI